MEENNNVNETILDEEVNVKNETCKFNFTKKDWKDLGKACLAGAAVGLALGISYVIGYKVGSAETLNDESKNENETLLEETETNLDN